MLSVSTAISGPVLSNPGPITENPVQNQVITPLLQDTFETGPTTGTTQPTSLSTYPKSGVLDTTGERPRAALYKKQIDHLREDASTRGIPFSQRLDHFAKRRYAGRGANHGGRLLTDLRKIDPSLEVLIVDPGLALRMDQFISFAKKHKKAHPQTLYYPWELRDQFSQSLGMTTVYRSLALNETEANIIAKEGLLPRVLREPHTEKQVCLQYLTQNLQEVFSDRVDNNTNAQNDTLQSVTSYNSIGNSVADSFRNARHPVIYEFEIKLPKLDLLSPDGQIMYKLNPYSSAVESFVPLKIEPSEITGVQTYDKVSFKHQLYRFILT